jgi:hypothetical protein
MNWFQDRTRCYHGGNQHRFEPRYSEKQIANPTYLKAAGLYNAVETVAIMEQARRDNLLNVYLGDVCRWCGKVVGRP